MGVVNYALNETANDLEDGRRRALIKIRTGAEQCKLHGSTEEAAQRQSNCNCKLKVEATEVIYSLLPLSFTSKGFVFFKEFSVGDEVGVGAEIEQLMQ